jgi:uncharacterized protein YneF (UPF0154 family)
MDIAALIVWVITALGGFVLLGTWIQRGGMKQQRSGTSRLPAPIVFGHFGLAAAGLVVWIVYVVTDTQALAWVAVVLLVLIALLGFTMFARWLPARRAAPAAGAEVSAEVPAEQHLPVPVVAAHGVVAVATVLLVLLSALGVGGS